MPLCDDLALPLSEVEIERRRFLGLLGSGALGLAGAGTAITAIRFMEPNVIYEQETRFAVGRAEDIAPGTVLVLPRRKVYVVRTAAGLVAMSAVCTHLGCMTRFEREQGRIFCPCHGSRFDLSGRVTGGPAPRPLPRLHVEIDRGRVVVDAGRRVADDFVLEVA